MNQNGTFSYCGCFSGDQDVCCTVILQNNVAKKKGTCPPCGASGQCVLVDNSQGNDNEPTCKNIFDPPPPN